MAEGVIRALVRFDDGVPDDLQAKALFDLEKTLRSGCGLDIRVFKDRMPDDSLLRRTIDLKRAAK